MLWTILMVIGGVVLLLVLVVMAIYVNETIKEKRKEREVKESGRPVLGALVMANNTLADPDGLPEAPGLVVFGFYKAGPKLTAALKPLAERIYDLYEKEDVDSLSPVCREFSLLLKDHNYRDGRRNPVPEEVAGPLKVYVADLWIHRDRLPYDWAESRALACMVTGTDEGQIILLPHDDPRAQQLYTAISEEEAIEGPGVQG